MGGMGGMGGMGSQFGKSGKNGQSYTFRFGWVNIVYIQICFDKFFLILRGFH
jgi:hypothetical protein